MDYRKHISKSRLSMEEKADLRSEFLSRTGLKSSQSNYFIHKAPHYVGIAALSLLLIAIGASPFAIAAENAEPGDFLYPIKTTVNEPVKKVVRVVTGRSVAEPASVLVEDKESKEHEGEDGQHDIQKKPETKQVNTKKVSPAIVPAPASSTKQAVKELRKAVDAVVDEIPVNVEILSPDHEDKDSDKDEDGNKDQGVTEDVTDTVSETVKKTTDTVTDTLNKTTQGLNLSI